MRRCYPDILQPVNLPSASSSPSLLRFIVMFLISSFSESNTSCLFRFLPPFLFHAYIIFSYPHSDLFLAKNPFVEIHNLEHACLDPPTPPLSWGREKNLRATTQLSNINSIPSLFLSAFLPLPTHLPFMLYWISYPTRMLLISWVWNLDFNIAPICVK